MTKQIRAIAYFGGMGALGWVLSIHGHSWYTAAYWQIMACVLVAVVAAYKIGFNDD